MHKKRIFRFFRYTISTALAISMLLGDIGSSLGIAYAKEATEIQTESEYTEAGGDIAEESIIDRTDGQPEVSSSLPDGSEFVTETETITVSAFNGSLPSEYQDKVSGTYSVDGGPEKEFTGSAEVVIGKGKIADSEITVKVSVKDAPDITKTYTYIKKYDPNIKDTPNDSDQSINNAAVVEEAAVNAAAETDAYYATNPDGKVGKEATVTGMSDFTQDMLVARCGAWDVPNAWNGYHENSVADCYGLYAAWDDTNLYVGLEMVNTTDTWQREGEGSLLENGKISNVPIVLAMNVGNSPAFKTTFIAAENNYIWEMKTEYETRVDHIFVGSAKVGSGTPAMFLAQEDGSASYDKAYCLPYKENGITYTMTDGSISPQIMHLKGSDKVSDAYDSSKYVDAMTDGNGHNRKYDSFYFYTIPLKTLGIDKNYLTTNGIGIMGVGTRQESALDCIPHDPSMLDNTMDPYRAGDNTSYEKEDLDTITVPLACVGKLNSGGGSVVTSTPTPTATATPTATTAPTVTQGATETPTPTVGLTGEMNVNFGADRSAPHYNKTALTLKAIAKEGTAPYSYEFFIDNASVQNGANDSYTWKGISIILTLQLPVSK